MKSWPGLLGTWPAFAHAFVKSGLERPEVIISYTDGQTDSAAISPKEFGSGLTSLLIQ